VFVSEILQIPGTVTTPTTDGSPRSKIKQSSATTLTFTAPLVGVTNAVQQIRSADRSPSGCSGRRATWIGPNSRGGGPRLLPASR